uniref:U6 snRNA-associated Sm-like protein LSm1 n=1 Tax=Strongyloides papillosus TaxID=174720 RepID=A0A0N5BRB8_STREA
MELPNPYLVGAVSLFESLGKRIIVQLRDGKTLIGVLSSIDQFVNIVLDDAVERIFVDKYYGDIPRGVYLIRGENVILVAEVDEKMKVDLKEVDPATILTMHDEKMEEKQKEEERRAKLLGERGIIVNERQIRGNEMMLENMY